MRSFLRPAAALAFAAVLSTTAAAQDAFTPEQLAAATEAIASAQLSETAYQYLWCGGAFMLVKGYLTEQGAPQGDLDAVQGMADNNYLKAANELKPAGMAREAFIALAQHFYIVAQSQTGEGAIADHSQEECAASGMP
jgi:hypothetical protein